MMTMMMRRIYTVGLPAPLLRSMHHHRHHYSREAVPDTMLLLFLLLLFAGHGGYFTLWRVVSILLVGFFAIIIFIPVKNVS
jgi:Ca2+/Na+ antiporter